MSEQMQLRAYYYAFEPTGVQAVDKVLSAVACAGKAFHYTASWNDDCEWDGLAGKTPVDWIQNAAVEAAAEIGRLQVEAEARVAAARREGIEAAARIVDQQSAEVARSRNSYSRDPWPYPGTVSDALNDQVLMAETIAAALRALLTEGGR